MLNFLKQKNKQSGFTLIEMLVAVFIFSVALAALMGVAARGLKAARLAQQQVVADYLALEGIEVVRNLRDASFLLGSDTNTWLSIFSQDDCLEDIENGTTDGCAYSLTGTSMILYPCPAADECPVYKNSQGIYRQFQSVPNGYSLTGYNRSIHLERVGTSQDEIIVTVNVTWSTGSVQYVESLFLWL